MSLVVGEPVVGILPPGKPIVVDETLGASEQPFSPTTPVCLAHQPRFCAHLRSRKGKNLRSTPRTPQNTVGQMPHLGVAALTGVAPDSVWQGDDLLKSLEHLRAYGTVASAAADHTGGAALKLIDSATRTDYGVDIGRCIGQLLHCIPFSLACP
jgi:hypothetical protein